MTLNKKEVIQELCDLVTEVGTIQFKNDVPHDCFCESNDTSTDPVIDGEIIKFIRKAVFEKMNG